MSRCIIMRMRLSTRQSREEKTDIQFLADHKLYGEGSKSYCDLLPYFNAFFCSEEKEEIVS